MVKVKSVKFNFIMNTILMISSMIFPLLSFTYVSRIIGPAGTGAVSFTYSIVLYFSMFAQLGVPTYGIRACAKVRDDMENLSRTVQEILIINIITCAISYLCFGIALTTIPELRNEKTLFLVMGVMIFFNTIGVEWLYKGLEQYSYITIRSVIFKTLALIAMFLFIHEAEDYIVYGALYIFAAVGSNLLNFINLRKVINIKPIGNYHFKKHLKPIAAFFAMSVATTVYTNLDNVMLGFIKGSVENGYYDAAVKVKVVLVNLVTSLGTVLLPRVSYYIEKGMHNEFQKISKKAMKFTLLMAMPLMVYFIIFSNQSILLLSGAQFKNASLPMRLIMPTLLFIGVSNIVGIQILVPLGKEKTVLMSEIAGALIDIILNMLLIPNYGAAGAAIGTVVAEFTVMIVQIIAIRSIALPVLKNISYLKLLISLLISSAAVSWICYMNWNEFLILIVSSSIFFVTYCLVLYCLKEEMVREYVNLVHNKLSGFMKRNV